MRRVVCSEFGPLEQLQVVDEPDPVPGDGAVLIAVGAAGANYVDALMVEGPAGSIRSSQ